MVDAFEDNYVAWDWISKNVGPVMNVNPDGYHGSKHSEKVATTQKI